MAIDCDQRQLIITVSDYFPMLNATGFADTVPDETADGAIDFLAFIRTQAKRVKNNFIQFGAIRQWFGFLLFNRCF